MRTEPRESKLKFDSEKSKYEYAYDKGLEYNSRTALYLAKYIERQGWQGNILDMGCGNGLVVGYLQSKQFDICGIDLTLKALSVSYKIYDNEQIPDIKIDKHWFTEGSITKTDFQNNSFDYTFSCDVLEHIPPEQVNQVIKEICRITKKKSYHIIATFSDFRGGIEFHPSIKPIDWWKERFKNINDEIDIELISRKEFLYKMNNRIEGGL